MLHLIPLLTCAIALLGGAAAHNGEEHPAPMPTKPAPSPSSTGSCRETSICIDYVNECGKWYGG